MKKRLLTLIILIIVMTVGTCQAAGYTLPEKMYNQLAIGSGLKGTFSIIAEGDAFDTPFIKAISDATYSIRGILSGTDLHYYVFQTDTQEQQSAFSELYRKEGIYYFRSDMVQGQVLSFPTADQYLASLFPSEGDNPSAAPFMAKIISLSENERNDQWNPVLTRYQNELEMWLADFTVNAETVKLESGNSALDFTYEIPMADVNARIIKLFSELTADPDVMKILDSVMTKEEKDIYANANLIYYYQDALNSFDMNRTLRMNKRVSAMGDVLRYRLDLPLDEKSTGYQALSIESKNSVTFYTLTNQKQVIALGIPEKNENEMPSYEKSFWFAKVCTSAEDDEGKGNLSVRIDIRKTCETYNDDDEKSHEKDQYYITIEKDLNCLPEDLDHDIIPEFDIIKADVNLHYFSKYAQNSATTLEVQANISRGSSVLSLDGKVKTAAPWLFKPFDVNNPIQISADPQKELVPYLTDWISNAASMIHHTEETEQMNAESDKNPAEGAGQE